MAEECLICVSTQTEFYTCVRCKKQYCMKCHEKIKIRRCPYCRTHWHNLGDAIDNDEFLELVEVFMHFLDLH